MKRAPIVVAALAAAVFGFLIAQTTVSALRAERPKAYSVGSTATSYSVSASGWANSLPAIGAYPIGGADARNRTFVIESMYGIGADNSSFNFRVYLVKQASVGYDIQLYMTGTATLSAVMGSGPIGSTYRVADTITVSLATSATSPKGIGQVIQTAYASPAVVTFSPADDTNVAKVWLPDVGNYEYVIIDFNNDGSGTDTTMCGAVVSAGT